MDPLEMSGTEGALSRVRGQLRELRQEMLRMEERRLVGQEVDEAEYAAVKQEIDRLGREAGELARAHDQAIGEEFDTGGVGGRIMDFVVDYKWVLAAGLFMLAAIGVMFAVSRPQVSAEERARIQAAIRREAETQMKARAGDQMNAAEAAQMKAMREMHRADEAPIIIDPRTLRAKPTPSPAKTPAGTPKAP